MTQKPDRFAARRPVGIFAVHFIAARVAAVESFQDDREIDVIKRACQLGIQCEEQLAITPVAPQPKAYTGCALCLCTPCEDGRVHVLIHFESNRADLCIVAYLHWNEADIREHACVQTGKRLFLGAYEWNKLRVPLHEGMCLRVVDGFLGDFGFRDSRMRLDLLPFVACPWKNECHSMSNQLRHAFGEAVHAVWELPGELPRHLEFEADVLQAVHTGFECDASWEAANIFVFVDGSAQPSSGGSRAGAAFSVWRKDGGRLLFAGYHAAPVPVTPDLEDSRDIAAFAELAAITRAITWMMTLPCHVDCCVMFDSQRAGFSADGRWKPTGSATAVTSLACRLRCLVHLTSRFRNIFFHQVKAHHGCAGNELVDRLAKAAALGSIRRHIPVATDTLVGHEKLSWAWMLGHFDCDAPSLEEVLAQCVQKPEASTEVDMIAGVVDVGLEAAQQEPGLLPVIFDISVVSFNVMTAIDGCGSRKESGAKIELMQEQFHLRRWCFVGLQETRFRKAGVWPLKRYWSVQTQSSNGSFGVAL